MTAKIEQLQNRLRAISDEIGKLDEENGGHSIGSYAKNCLDSADASIHEAIDSLSDAAANS